MTLNKLDPCNSSLAGILQMALICHPIVEKKAGVLINKGSKAGAALSTQMGVFGLRVLKILPVPQSSVGLSWKKVVLVRS